jgi:hypothetical protein
VGEVAEYRRGPQLDEAMRRVTCDSQRVALSNFLKTEAGELAVGWGGAEGKGGEWEGAVYRGEAQLDEAMRCVTRDSQRVALSNFLKTEAGKWASGGERGGGGEVVEEERGRVGGGRMQEGVAQVDEAIRRVTRE